MPPRKDATKKSDSGSDNENENKKKVGSGTKKDASESDSENELEIKKGKTKITKLSTKEISEKKVEDCNNVELLRFLLWRAKTTNNPWLQNKTREILFVMRNPGAIDKGQKHRRRSRKHMSRKGTRKNTL